MVRSWPAVAARRHPEVRLRAWFTLGLACAALFVPAELRAQQHEQHAQHGAGAHASPYADLGQREIKALSEEEIDGLLSGEGMGMALPAELHGYPGPRHVLDLAAELELTPSQLEATRRIFESISAHARELGRQIVEFERELDAAFEEQTVTRGELDRLVAEIARHRAELRAVHLGAHLDLWPVLTEEQRHTYGRMRGY